MCTSFRYELAYWVWDLRKHGKRINLLYAGKVKRHTVCKRHVAIGMALVSNKLNVSFSPRYVSGIKIVTAFKCIFDKAMPKLSVSFRNHISQDSHKNQYPGPTCNFGFTSFQNSGKCWSNFRWSAISFSLVTHRSYWITCAVIRFMLWLVCLEPATTCWRGSIIIWRNMTSSLYQRIAPRTRWTVYCDGYLLCLG